MRLSKPHTAVYWAPVGVDRYGKTTFDDPVEISCRWNDAWTQAINPDGTWVWSRATIFTETELLNTGMLMFGTLDDLGSDFPEDVKQDQRVVEIFNVSATDNLKGTQTIYQALVR
jgi:hypothetical protein